MIPQFNDHGVLPPGIHPATLDEIDSRFGVQSEIRGVQMQSISWMVGLAIRAGVLRIVLNGSFVTDIIEPNDVDCVLLTGRGFPKDEAAEADLRAGLPFLDIAIVGQRDFKNLVEVMYATDRFYVKRDDRGLTMTLQSEQELTNTRDKLAFLEKCYAETRSDREEDPHVRELSLESLKRLINQLKEEIVRYECRQPAQG